MATKIKTMDDILMLLPVLEAQAAQLTETLIANLIMVSEIPAPTFDESARIKLLTQRMLECGLQNVSSDEAGNGVGIIPGKAPQKNILLVAHADTVHSFKADHTLSVLADEIIGPGVADNSLGLAILATLPTLLEKLNIQFESNLLLLGSTKGLGRGNLDGLRFFLENNSLPLEAGICIEGAQLGRLSFTAQGMLRGEIMCNIPEDLDWQRLSVRSVNSAVITINEIINHMLEIPLPRRPRTSIVYGAVRGGKGYNNMATQSSLRFEVRSESAEIVQKIRENIDDIVADVAARFGAEIKFNIVSTRNPGGLPIGHPLVKSCRRIMKSQVIKPQIFPSISELSELINHDILGITLGITEASNLHNINETIRIKPIYKGLAQLLAVLLAIDGGFCNEPE